MSSCTASCWGKLPTNGSLQLTNGEAVLLKDDSSSLSLVIFVISLSKAQRAINTDSIKAETLTKSFVCISSIKWKCQLDVTRLILVVIFWKRWLFSQSSHFLSSPLPCSLLSRPLEKVGTVAGKHQVSKCRTVSGKFPRKCAWFFRSAFLIFIGHQHLIGDFHWHSMNLGHKK